jgi:hypothetical protein
MGIIDNLVFESFFLSLFLGDPELGWVGAEVCLVIQNMVGSVLKFVFT